MTAPAIDTILDRHAGCREDIIPILQQIQESQGYIDPDTVGAMARRLRISENEIYGVATFYAQFRFTPPGEHHIHICMGTACHVRGGERLSDAIEHRLGIKDGETTPDRKFDLNRVACLGCCALAPVVMIDGRVYSQVTVLKLRELLDEYENA